VLTLRGAVAEMATQTETSTKKRIYLSSPHMSDEGYEMQYIQKAFIQIG